MAGGVFYREFTKFNAFSGVTALGVVHTHLFLLGMVFFLLAALFQMNVNLLGHKNFKKFYLIYNLGVAIMVIMLIVRGVTQVQGIALSRGFDAAISGIAGIGHIFCLLYTSLRDKRRHCFRQIDFKTMLHQPAAQFHNKVTN